MSGKDVARPWQSGAKGWEILYFLLLLLLPWVYNKLYLFSREDVKQEKRNKKKSMGHKLGKMEEEKNLNSCK